MRSKRGSNVDRYHTDTNLIETIQEARTRGMAVESKEGIFFCFCKKLSHLEENNAEDLDRQDHHNIRGLAR